MLPDMNTLPISGGLVLALVVWALVSVFALGPEVAEREIHRAAWHQTCKSELVADITSQRPERTPIPQLSCQDIGGLADKHLGHGAGNQLCEGVGSIAADIMDLALRLDPNRIAAERARELEEQRRAKAIDLAPMRCSCAATLVTGDRVRWGLHAGSGRFLGDGAQTLDAELTRALHSPDCALKPEG